MYVFVLASRNRGADVDVGRDIYLLDGADVADGCGGVVAMPSMPETCPALGETAVASPCVDRLFLSTSCRTRPPHRVWRKKDSLVRGETELLT